MQPFKSCCHVAANMFLLASSHAFVSHHPVSSPSSSHLPVNVIRENKKFSNEKEDGKEKNTTPGYEFFRGDGSYVPSGLSRDDYARIRKVEIEKENKMNYGAWGPRFKRTDAPDGDWMIMTNLWTAGRVDRPSSRIDGNMAGDTRTRSRIRVVLRAIRERIQAFVLLYLLLDCLEVGFYMWKWKEDHMNPKKAIFDIVRTVLFHRHATKLKVVKVETVKVALSMAIAPLANVAMERLNRRYLWSRKRMSAITFALALVSLGLWHVVLSFIRFV